MTHRQTNLVVQPLRAFIPCPTCGATICVRVWHPRGGAQPGPWWEELVAPQAMVTGTVHTCPEEGRGSGED